MNRELANLFPDADHEFQFGMRPGSAADFFAASANGEQLLAERRRCLDEFPERHLCQQPGADDLVAETDDLLRQWNCLPPANPDERPDCETLGRRIEPDFILLRRDEHRGAILEAGCVCFPSSWRLPDKLGLPIGEIHEPVPGLNDQLGPTIARFLNRMKPGVAHLRANWGLSRSPDLNQHLDRELPRLPADPEPEECFVRVEHQALVALPQSSGVLFGIRLEVLSLAVLLTDGTLANGLARALRTMPDAVAEYKNLAHCRRGLLGLLERQA